MLEARNRRHERALRLLGQRGRNAVRIDGRIVDALRLEKNLMAVAIGEADHLVLDRRTIAWAAPGDRARIDGGAMRIRLDDAMGLGGGAGDVARELRRRDRGRHRGEEFRLWIAKLDLEALPVDGCAVEPGRGSGLEPRRARSRRASRLWASETEGGSPKRPAGVRWSPRWIIPRRKVPVVRTIARQAIVRPSASSTPVTAPASDAIRAASPSTTVRFAVSADERLHGAPIELSVGLGARPLDGGTLAAIEDAELNAGRVGGARHHAVERVDLAHQMALAQAADRRIAGHFADRRETVGDERGRGAAARRRGRGFASRMPAADDNDVKFHFGRPPVSRETCTTLVWKLALRRLRACPNALKRREKDVLRPRCCRTIGIETRAVGQARP